MGYDFAQAVADVVDNSVEAGATRVDIDVEFDGDDSWVRIVDNGKGMTPDELREAMRYGAERDYDEEDLGKFGLGLKTASMSQCQRLSVASRWNPERADVSAYSWDLEHIERTNRWEILPLERNGLGPALRAPLKDSRGTVVLWQRLDRILGYKHPYGELARKRLFQMCRDIEVHLGMVFHRFISGEARRRKLKITVNGNEVLPWDPFCRIESGTRALAAVTLSVDYEGTQGDVRVDPFVLPSQEDFSSPEAFRNASGPANWNQQQGFYIYRSDRMIQSGGWSNLRAPDEHTKLARIGVHFTPKLDEAFRINVAKMRVQLPALLRDDFRKIVGVVTKIAREVYAGKEGTKPPTPTGATANPTPPTTVMHRSATGDSAKASSESDTDVPVRLTLDEWASLAISAAEGSELKAIEAVVGRLKKGNTS